MTRLRCMRATEQNVKCALSNGETSKCQNSAMDWRCVANIDGTRHSLSRVEVLAVILASPPPKQMPGVALRHGLASCRFPIWVGEQRRKVRLGKETSDARHALVRWRYRCFVSLQADCLY